MAMARGNSYSPSVVLDKWSMWVVQRIIEVALRSQVWLTTMGLAPKKKNLSLVGHTYRDFQEKQHMKHNPPPPPPPPPPPSMVGSPNVSHTEGAGMMIGLLKDKSVDELKKLLSDKDAYQQFLLSFEQVKLQNNLHDDLQKETLQIARKNSDQEPHILELRNQCRIIRTTELAAAQEKLNTLEGRKEETLRGFAPSMLLQRLQEAMNEAEEESEILHQQLLRKEINLGGYVQKYTRLRTAYHRRVLIHLAATTASA